MNKKVKTKLNRKFYGVFLRKEGILYALDGWRQWSSQVVCAYPFEEALEYFKNAQKIKRRDIFIVRLRSKKSNIIIEDMDKKYWQIWKFREKTVDNLQEDGRVKEWEKTKQQTK